MKTERLYFRRACVADSDFIYKLVNDDDWLSFIGDRKVRSQQDAVRFINESLNAKQPDGRLGLRICCRRDDLINHDAKKDTPIGLCGLLQRDYLDSIDIGYAIAKEHRSFGYATESAKFYKEYAIYELKVSKVYATVLQNNTKSICILRNLGFKKVKWHKESGKLIDSLLLFQFQSSWATS